MNLNSIMIGTEDADALGEYYAKIFGPAGMDEGGYRGWKIGSGYLSIIPHDQVKGKNATPGRLLWNIESADVEGDFERMKAAGATVVQEPYHPGEAPEFSVATFSDPDGNYFQLMSPMPD